MSFKDGKSHKKKSGSEAEEVREILEAVADNLPKILDSFSTLLFSSKSGEELGKAIGAFYKSLVDSGIPPERATQMTEQYMESATSVSRMLQKAMDSIGGPKAAGKRIMIEGDPKENGLVISMNGKKKHLDLSKESITNSVTPEDLEKQAQELLDKAKRLRSSEEINND